MSKFRTDAILSAIGGKLLCDFSDMHACIEAMAGGPVWTHQLPAVMRQLEPLARAAFPELAAIDTSGINRENVAAWQAEHAELLAVEREVFVLITAPSSPFEHLPEGKDVVVVKVQP
jgi:hypothetical protein